MTFQNSALGASFQRKLLPDRLSGNTEEYRPLDHQVSNLSLEVPVQLQGPHQVPAGAIIEFIKQNNF